MNRSAAHPPEEDLIALALGESEAGPRAALEAHLDACEPCRREYVGLIETLGTMAYAAPPQAPPARLRANVLEAAAREPRAVPAPVATSASPRRVAWRGWPVWGPRLVVGAGALAAIVFAALVVINGSGSTRSIALRGVPGTVVVSGHTAALESADFAPLPVNRTYEMWVIHKGAARPAGVFRTAASPVVVGGTVAPGDTVAVTREPAGGSVQPTTPPVASAAF